MSGILSIVALALTLGVTWPGVERQRPPDIVALLNRFAAGDITGVVDALARFDDAQAKDFSKTLMAAGRVWAAADPVERRRRQTIVAALALEFAVARIDESDWIDSGCRRCLVADAASLLSSRGATDEAEHAWLLAAVALGEGHHDRLFLTARLTDDPRSSKAYDLSGSAAARFPADSRFALARTVALTMAGLDVWIEGSAPAPGTPLVRILPATNALGGGSGRQQRRQEVSDQLRTLVADPVVGMEARLRYAHLAFVAGDYNRAVAVAESVFSSANDDERYLARFISGQSQQALGRLDGAMREFELALEARPGAQSATLALAALRLQHGSAEAAYALLDGAPQRRNEDDPWRLFPYGEFAKLPHLMAAMRVEIMR